MFHVSTFFKNKTKELNIQWKDFIFTVHKKSKQTTKYNAIRKCTKVTAGIIVCGDVYKFVYTQEVCFLSQISFIKNVSSFTLYFFPFSS